MTTDGNLDAQIFELLGSPLPADVRAAPPVRVAVPTLAGGVSDANAYGAYEGADRFDEAMALWGPAIQSADADILPDKDIGDARSRDMLRNDAYVQGASNLHKDNIVGSQFLLNSRPATRALWGMEDDTWEEEFQQEVEELFDLYAESPDNWIDATRRNNFTAMIRLGVGVHLAGGEVLATVEWDKNAGGDFKTTIQMIDLDRLSTPNDMRVRNYDDDIRGGIRYDAKGAPQTYFIRTEHPSDIRYSYREPARWKPVAARKPWGRLQVIHILEQTRVDQSRGFSEMLASLKAMRIGHKYRDINLQRALTQSIYAAAITSDLPSEQVFAQLGGGDVSADGAQKAVTAYAQGFLGAISAYSGASRNLQIDGVKIPHLFPGTKLEMLSPGQDSGMGAEFEQSLLRYIAASVGVSYEQLSRDYTNTNYSSARAAMNETHKFMQARKKAVADRMASAIFRLWLEEAINANRLSTFPARKAGMLYTNGRLNLKFDAISRSDWIGAARGQIDELKETEAAILRVEHGLSTQEDELAKLGKDWRKVNRQLARENRLRESLGLAPIGGDENAAADRRDRARQPGNDEQQQEAA